MKKKMIPVTLLAVLLLSGIWLLLSVRNIHGSARAANCTGMVREASQLLVKEELYGEPNDALIDRLDRMIDELVTGEGENNLVKLADPGYQAALGTLSGNWQALKNEILQARQSGSQEALYRLSETFFQDADRAASLAAAYTEKQARQAAMLFYVLLGLIAVGTCVFAAYAYQNRRTRRQAEAAAADKQKEKETLEKMAAALHSPLDDLSELMYIADLETYDLLFFNKAGLRNFELDSYEGKKCYQVLRGRDTPCEACSSHVSPDGDTYTWEDTNPVTGRHYVLKDREILWEGRPARLEIAFDITEAETEKQSLRYTLKMEALIMDCVRTLYQGHKPAETVPKILESLGQFLDAERSYIFLVHDGLAYNDFEWCKPGITPQRDNLQSLPLSFFDSWMPRFNRRECVLIPDLELLKESSPEEYEILHSQNIHSLVAAPMECDGVFCGCLGVDNPPRERLTYISTMLQTLCYFLMLSIKRAEDEEQLSRLSFHDTLTSFFNRNRFIKDSDALENSHIPVGVVYLDVNGLKDMNDKRGHAYGDKLLMEAARRLKEVFYNADLYRIGGDEFVAVCRYIEEQRFNEQVQELKNRFQQGSDCCAAIGSQWCAALQDMNEITSQADARMYEDKKLFYRKNPTSKRYRHQSDDLLELSNPNILESEINKNRFAVYMQPKVSSVDRTAIGAEALIRYYSEAGVPVLPGSFLPLLEEAETISQIDFFVFESVCSRIKRWLDTGKEVYPVSINFSQHSLAQPSFVKQISAICEKYEVAPRFLEVEITEMVLESGEYDLLDLIHQLRRAGFIVALANFETSADGVHFLSSAEFDVLKLNKAMIVDVLQNLDTISSIVDICHEKGIRLVAEGIETEEQMCELCKCGVELLQGFLFSKPISMEEYEEKYLSKPLLKES
ncbi:sensor domain-containing diguanylate cyclase [Anaeromassilibacillus senegalensis]|uniref:sensor domain-containing diguanylate cyclase n=1 Tax=Anaeromassilibacillus senegalensis TaxID=1673717 RepID=UPI0006802EE1|nr:GGDEF domain-containing protein [Anaeromassilibacillus senegalensis]